MQGLYIIPRALLLALALAPALGRGEAPPVADELGCFHDEVTDSYFCETGLLAGREFLSKAEAQDAYQEAKEKARQFGTAVQPESKPAPAKDHFIVMSWNMKALVHEDSDYDRAAIVLGDADLVALQEVDLHSEGKGFLNVIANLVQAKIQEKVCRAWVQGGNGERQTYGFLWKERTIGYLDGDGSMKDSCGEVALTIRQSKKMKLASQGTFFLKSEKKMFTLVTLFSEKKPKVPNKEVTEIFQSFNDSKWPILVAGDLKMGAANSAFKEVRKMGFQSALAGSKGGWDNFWFRSATLSQAGAVNLYRRFSDARHKDIERDFAGIFPIAAEFTLKENLEPVTTKVVSKKKSKKKSKP